MSNVGNYRIAYIYVRDAFAGILKETDYGYSFQYDKEYLKTSGSSPVSLSLPKREEEFTSSFLFPFFDGLIPEGRLLDITSTNWKENENDRFGILLVACSDPIGCVSVKKEKK